MEIKKGLDISTQDFWYDLTDGERTENAIKGVIGKRLMLKGLI